jgi:acetyl/propionyl-CoA carboxylase alpha subunit
VRYRYQSGDKIYEIRLERRGDGYRALVDGRPYDLEIMDSQPGELSLRFEGQVINLYWAVDDASRWVSLHGCTYLLEKPAQRRSRATGDPAAENLVRAPMPAQVRNIEVSIDDLVEKGDTLMVLEAMKMEIRIRAPRSGRVARLPVAAGQTVNRDEALVEIQAVQHET